MTDREILSNAIDKAIANGWELEHPVHTNASIKEFIAQCYEAIDQYSYMWFATIAGIIFSHSFAKAFWGGEPEYDNEGTAHYPWQFYLTQMVLEENPIKYLERFL